MLMSIHFLYIFYVFLASFPQAFFDRPRRRILITQKEAVNIRIRNAENYILDGFM